MDHGRILLQSCAHLSWIWYPSILHYIKLKKHKKPKKPLSFINRCFAVHFDWLCSDRHLALGCEECVNRRNTTALKSNWIENCKKMLLMNRLNRCNVLIFYCHFISLQSLLGGTARGKRENFWWIFCNFKMWTTKKFGGFTFANIYAILTWEENPAASWGGAENIFYPALGCDGPHRHTRILPTNVLINYVASIIKCTWKIL